MASTRVAEQRLPDDVLIRVFDYAEVESQALAASLAQLSSYWQQRYERRLYSTMILKSEAQVRSARLALQNRPQLRKYVQDLSIVHHSLARVEDRFSGLQNDRSPPQTAPSADALLQLVSDVRRIQLSRSHFYGWDQGLYQSALVEEAHLHGCDSRDSFKALIMKDDKLLEDMAGIADSAQAPGESPNKQLLRIKLGDRLPLKKVHLHTYSGWSLSDLAMLSGLTHVVLTRAHLPKGLVEGLPGVRVLPRSSVMHLLSSQRLQRLIIQDTARILATIIQQLQPIDDERLIFRAIPSGRARNDFVLWNERAERWRSDHMPPQAKPSEREDPLWTEQDGDSRGATMHNSVMMLAAARREAELSPQANGTSSSAGAASFW